MSAKHRKPKSASRRKRPATQEAREERARRLLDRHGSFVAVTPGQAVVGPGVTTFTGPLAEFTTGGVGAFGQTIAPRTISCCMIARNEQAMLPDCLRSLRGFVDELVMVDTGSTDATREVFTRLAPRVAKTWRLVEHPWNDHFAEARNAGLRHCRGEWVMFADADERLVFPHGAEAGRQCVLTLPQRVPQAAELFLACLNDPSPESGFPVSRIARNHPDLAFHGRIHEHFRYPDALERATVQLPPEVLHLRHLGYVPTEDARKGRPERNLRLLRLAVAEEPLAEAPGLRWYLAVELRKAGRHDEALDCYRQAWSVYRGTEPGRRPPVWFSCALDLGDALAELHRPAEALEHLQEVVHLQPNWAAALHRLGAALMAMGREEEALPYLYTALQHASERVWNAPHDPALGPRVALALAMCLFRLGRPPAEARAAARAVLSDAHTTPDLRERAQALLEHLQPSPAMVGSGGFVGLADLSAPQLLNVPPNLW